MQSFAVNFLYLSPAVLTDPAWAHLGRFLHPGSRDKENQALILGRHLDLSWHPYLSFQAMDWESKGTRKVLIRHDIVASILEVSSHTNQLGFVDLSAVREQLKDQ
ncbi:hypothetical protein [Delftia acidovorans]|uniref:hypothetical protein n=1 Tax=Delftia TaxID=80865 RepID=UPI0028EFD264|nr:hypothetical protein [Delftia acidovorans]